MTASKIKYILSDLGYEYNADEPYRMDDKVASIVLNTDQVIYPGQDAKFNFIFKLNESLLEVYHKDSEIPTYYISTDLISGFNLISALTKAMPYKIGRAL